MKKETRILEDIKNGVPDSTIMNKYNLTHELYREILRHNLAKKLRAGTNPNGNGVGSGLSEFFHHIARKASDVVGSPWSFITALLLLILWATSGPFFRFSDTWQLIINTATTIVTFLMVFLIQNTQNRNDKATQLKLDELLRAIEGARTGLVNLETRTDAELDNLQAEFQEIVEKEIKSVQSKNERHIIKAN